MFEPYQKASKNDLKYIREWIDKNPPGAIDQPWYAAPELTPGLITVVGGYTGFIAAGFLMTPAAPVTLLVAFFSFSLMAVGGVLGSVQNYYENKHEGWTLLQFAAENGAIDVAKFLIGKNASRQGKNGRDYIDIATQNSHAKFVNEMRKMELETLRATINSQSQKISQSKNPDDTKETALLKKEIFDLNEVIQKFEVFKEKAEEDILKLVEKYNYLVKKYEGKSEEDQENSSKSLGLGIK